MTRSGPMIEPVTFGCVDAGRLAADYVRSELTDAQHHWFEGHLVACPSCHARVAFERRLADKLRELREASVSGGG